MADPEQVEAAVEEVYAQVGSARKKRLRLHAQRPYSTLLSVETARRCDRTPAAVTLAVRHLGAMARKDRGRASGLALLKTKVRGNIQN